MSAQAPSEGEQWRPALDSSAMSAQAPSEGEQWRPDLDSSAQDGYSTIKVRVELHFGKMIADTLKLEQPAKNLVELQEAHVAAKAKFETALKQHNDVVGDSLRKIGAEIRKVLVEAYHGDAKMAAVKYYGYDVGKNTKYKGVQGAVRAVMEHMFAKRVCYAVKEVSGVLIPAFYCDTCNLRSVCQPPTTLPIFDMQ